MLDPVGGAVRGTRIGAVGAEGKHSPVCLCAGAGGSGKDEQKGKGV